nr:PREDICTED: uncharacterized protein LOC103560884 [Equus przewalskii]
MTMQRHLGTAVVCGCSRSIFTKPPNKPASPGSLRTSTSSPPATRGGARSWHPVMRVCRARHKAWRWREQLAVCAGRVGPRWGHQSGRLQARALPQESSDGRPWHQDHVIPSVPPWRAPLVGQALLPGPSPFPARGRLQALTTLSPRAPYHPASRSRVPSQLGGGCRPSQPSRPVLLTTLPPAAGTSEEREDVTSQADLASEGYRQVL